jgi:serine/threonine protein kinase
MNQADQTTRAGGPGNGHPGSSYRFAPGDELSERYRIVDLLGVGAMAEVYEATDRILGEPIALKVLKTEVASDVVTVERFRRESQLARQVTHRNVCRTYDFGQHRIDDGAAVTFITMELLRGSSLAHHLAAKGRMTPDDALPLVEQMAAGLDAAHAAGVVHRDLKPGNIMLVAEARRLVITDFGLARNYGLDDQTLTITGETIGTPLYMAPEQVMAGAQSITPATDIYALGMVMYEMLTGALPFTGGSVTVMALKRLKEVPPPPRLLQPDLDPRWQGAIMRCLERDPQRRFACAGDVVEALKTGAGAAPTGEGPGGAPPRPRKGLFRRRR